MYLSDIAQVIPFMAPAFKLGFSVGFEGTVVSREHEGENIDLVLIVKLYQDVLVFCHSICDLAEHSIFLLVFKIYTQTNMRNQILSWSKSTDSHPSQASHTDLYQLSVLLKLFREQANHMHSELYLG